jgi:penicillin-binding protein A
LNFPKNGPANTSLWPVVAVILLGAALFISRPSSNEASAAGPEFGIFEDEARGSVSFSDALRILPQLDDATALPRENVRPASKAARVFPPPSLEKVNLALLPQGGVQLSTFPGFSTQFGGQLAGITSRSELVYYTLNPKLQAFAQSLVSAAKAPHVAVVAMDPRTGQILALAEKSKTIKDLSLHSGFPAASVFKLVTTTAALELAPVGPLSPINFRGGIYTLNRWNYLPNPKSDRKSMTLAEALGKSCNPVFARVALKYLNPKVLRRYSELFGFNKNLGFELSLPASSASVPDNDIFELGRTAAGFGEVTLSPIHAAALVAGIANGGLLPKPSIVERVTDREGTLIYKARAEALTRIMQPATAKKLLGMMEYTTTIGTSRKEFMKKKKQLLSGVSVAAKTGTLSGTNPEGLNHWFVAAAPISDPRIAISVIVVDPQSGTKASRIGKQIIEKYLER